MTAIAIDARMVQSSGIGTVIANVSRRLIAENADWKFVLAGDAHVLRGMGWTDAENVEIRPFNAPLYSVRELLGFPCADCDVTWSPNYNIPLRLGHKLMVTIHDAAHLVLPEMQSAAKRLYARIMFSRVRRRADAIIYVSRFTQAEFHRLVGIPKGREFVVRGGVDESWFDIPYGAPPARPYILFVGNVKPHKNLSRLLDAFDRVRGELPHDLLIAGRKDGFIISDRAVLARIGEFGGRVAFTGHLPDLVLKQLYAGADTLVLPSLYEGFGLPPVEAMAAGCPVLVSRAAALPEVCQDAALYCDPLDVSDMAAQLKRILSDKELRQSLRQRGLDRARALTWDSCVQGYETAIRDLLAMPAS